MRVALALAALAAPALGAACAAPFDAAKDYHAGLSFTPRFATTFTVAYARSYKVVTVTPRAGASTTITLSVCGAPLPSRAALGLAPGAALVQLSLPLTAALSSATYAPFLELLGARSNVSAVAGAAYFDSACLRSLVLGGAVADVADAFGGFDAAAAAATAPGVVAFGGTGPYNTLALPNAAPVDETGEALPLGVAEYLFYFAAFFDREAAAAAAFEAISSRYACTAAAAAAAAAAPAAPVVLWAYRFTMDGSSLWYVASCPAWYCPLVRAAGGELVTVSAADAAAGISDAAFAALAARATHFVYTGSDWDAIMAPAAAAGATTPLGALLAGIPAVKAKRVFDILGSGVNAWFANTEVAPDAVLQDLLLALKPAAAAAGGLKGPAVFIRNVFAAPAGALAPVSACADAKAPAALLSVNTCPAPAAAATGLTPQQVGAIAGTLGGAALVAGLAAGAWALAAAKAKAAAAATAKLTAAAPAAAAPAAAVAV